MVGIDSSGELGISRTPKVTEDLIKSFKGWERHYSISVRANKIKNGYSSVSEGYAQINGINQALHPGNLNELKVTTNINKNTEAAFSLFVNYLNEKFPEALADWVERHNEEHEFLSDGNDPRIRKISELAQQVLRKK